MEMGYRHVVYHLYGVFTASNHLTLVGRPQGEAIRRARQLQDALPTIWPKTSASSSFLATGRHWNYPTHLRFRPHPRSVHDRRRRSLEVGNGKGDCAAGYRHHLCAGMDHLGEEIAASYGSLPSLKGSSCVGCFGHRYHSQLWLVSSVWYYGLY
jgi:hypothetical protein